MTEQTNTAILFIFTLIFKFFPSNICGVSFRLKIFQQVSRRRQKRFNQIFPGLLMECQNILRVLNYVDAGIDSEKPQFNKLSRNFLVFLSKPKNI